MEEAIVLYSIPAIGHLIAMVELGKLILAQKPSLAVHVLVPGLSYNSGSIDPYIASVSSITFHRLPSVSLPPTIAASPHHELLILETLRLNRPNVRQALVSFSETFSVRAFIMDFFCMDALSVAAELGVSPFCFFTCPVGCLSATFQLPIIHDVMVKTGRDGFRDLVFDVPGMPPLPHSDLPEPFLDPYDQTAQLFLYRAVMLQKSAGIIVNTFEALESRTMRAISAGQCLLDKPTPPVYAIGPLITSGGGHAGGVDCLAWLDKQPKQSVVFLCFGSMGVFSKEQLQEIASGLERSRRRFLWVVRDAPPRKDKTVDISGSTEPDLESLLPTGFLDRTREIGFVVKKWSPQVPVLSHDSVGGFVTHCGWNSVLEAVCSGVPMVAWPLYAEQRLNRLLLVEEMRIAFPMEETDGGFVTAEEVEKRVRQLMESAEGESIRERVMGMKLEAEAALINGGSSHIALTKLIEFNN